MNDRTTVRLLIFAAVVACAAVAFTGAAAADAEAGGSFQCDQGNSGGGGDASVSTEDGVNDPDAGSTAAGLVHFAAGGPGPADCDENTAGETEDSHAQVYVDSGPAGAGSVGFCSTSQSQAPTPQRDNGEYEEGYCGDR